MDSRRARAALAAAAVIWGTLGLLVRHIPLPSSLIALVRGVLGAAFLLLLARLSGRHLTLPGNRKARGLLVLSGALIGVNWILLFEAYRYTTVASATLCYYMAPVMLILASSLLFRERLTLLRGLCVLGAVLGVLLISGVLSGGAVGLRGVLLGLGAAALYCSVILLNRLPGAEDRYSATVVQLSAAALVLAPYILLTEDLSALRPTGLSLLLLAVLGLVHTGLAYGLYFAAVPKLSGASLALLSYLDPLTAILLSALFLGEPLGWTGIAGTVLILGAAVASETAGARQHP